MSRLALRGVTKLFGETAAVRQVDLDIAEGEFVCFLGPSGCGKTTLIRIIAGLEAPSAGTITLDGEDITEHPTHRRNFGMVFQGLALFPHLDVAGNIAYSLKMRGVPTKQRAERVAELLDLVALPHVGGRRVDQLSGGQRQRVAIARALAQEPRLFLMDEPLSALDAKMRDHMQVELRQLQQKVKITTIFVTHDQREAMTIADTIVVMSDGIVQQVGPPLEVYRKPANTFVAGFIGQSNLLDVRVAQGGAVSLEETTLALGAVPDGLVPGDAATLCVRPEDVGLERASRTSDRCGTITFVRQVGSEVELRLRWREREIVAVTSPARWQDLAGAEALDLHFPPQRCVLLAE